MPYPEERVYRPFETVQVEGFLHRPFELFPHIQNTIAGQVLYGRAQIRNLVHQREMTRYSTLGFTPPESVGCPISAGDVTQGCALTSGFSLPACLECRLAGRYP